MHKWFVEKLRENVCNTDTQILYYVSFSITLDLIYSIQYHLIY